MACDAKRVTSLQEGVKRASQVVIMYENLQEDRRSIIGHQGLAVASFPRPVRKLLSFFC